MAKRKWFDPSFDFESQVREPMSEDSPSFQRFREKKLREVAEVGQEGIALMDDQYRITAQEYFEECRRKSLVREVASCIDAVIERRVAEDKTNPLYGVALQRIRREVLRSYMAHHYAQADVTVG